MNWWERTNEIFARTATDVLECPLQCDWCLSKWDKGEYCDDCTGCDNAALYRRNTIDILQIRTVTHGIGYSFDSTRPTTHIVVPTNYRASHYDFKNFKLPVTPFCSDSVTRELWEACVTNNLTVVK